MTSLAGFRQFMVIDINFGPFPVGLWLFNRSTNSDGLSDFAIAIESIFFHCNQISKNINMTNVFIFSLHVLCSQDYRFLVCLFSLPIDSTDFFNFYSGGNALCLPWVSTVSASFVRSTG